MSYSGCRDTSWRGEGGRGGGVVDAFLCVYTRFGGGWASTWKMERRGRSGMVSSAVGTLRLTLTAAEEKRGGNGKKGKVDMGGWQEEVHDFGQENERKG